MRLNVAFTERLEERQCIELPAAVVEWRVPSCCCPPRTAWCSIHKRATCIRGRGINAGVARLMQGCGIRAVVRDRCSGAG